MSAAIGIMLSVSRHAARKDDEKSANDRDEAMQLGNEMNAINAAADN